MTNNMLCSGEDCQCDNVFVGIHDETIKAAINALEACMNNKNEPEECRECYNQAHRELVEIFTGKPR